MYKVQNAKWYQIHVYSYIIIDTNPYLVLCCSIIPDVIPDEKIIMESMVKVVKNKHQKHRQRRQKVLLENQVEHMKEAPISMVQDFVQNDKIQRR